MKRKTNTKMISLRHRWLKPNQKWAKGRSPILDQNIIARLKPARSNDPSPWDILARLYDSELNGGLESDWDGGFQVWLGGRYNGHIVEASFGKENWNKIAPWLDYQIRRHFPL